MGNKRKRSTISERLDHVKQQDWISQDNYESLEKFISYLKADSNVGRLGSTSTSATSP